MRVIEVQTSQNELRYVVIDDKGTLVAPIVRYLKYLDLIGYARNTLYSYATMLRLYWEYVIQADVDWRHVTVDDMARFVLWLKLPSRSLKVIPAQPVPQARSNRTINHALSVVSGFYEYLWRVEEVSTHLKDKTTTYLPGRTRRYKSFLHHIAKDTPVAKNILKQAEDKRQRPKTISKAQVQLLLDACTNQRDRLLVRLLYETAMRIGEALALWVEDVDVAENRIHVRDRGQLENEAEIKTINCPRSIDVSSSLIDEIVAYVGRVHTARVETNHLFLKQQGARAGQALDYDDVESLFRRLRRKTGLVVSPHTLRHTMLTALAEEGWAPELLQERAGHATFQQTYQIYVHPSQDRLRAEWEKTQDAVSLTSHSERRV
jgi:integrase/recombinase XerD